ncbi:MAG: DUF72 domain-containing protein [Actinomycetota bacterium]
MGPILVGITGWTEPTLIKESDFYPPDAKTPEARLRFYASQFPIVEVDATYYSPPNERNSVLWIERTPKDFVFNVKAYSMLTQHPTRVDRMYKDLREQLPPELLEKRNLYTDKVPPDIVDEVWQRFHDALMPLHSAGKLGSVLFQFPPWFVISRKNKDYIVEVSERLEDFRPAIELRHKSWFEGPNVEETLSFLEKHSLPFVCVDMPQGFDSSVPPVAAATASDLAIVRFHGRDPEQWKKKETTAAERFKYDYTAQELAEWTPKVEELAEQARETHVLMNNCYRDYAVKSARQFATLLDDEISEEG